MSGPGKSTAAPSLTTPVQFLKGVEMFTDSVYVGRGLSDWLARWKRNGWRTSARKQVKNVDLWKRLDELSDIHRVTYSPVIGHSGHPENERCDELAVAAYQKYL